jgi:hypothetical protein
LEQNLSKRVQSETQQWGMHERTKEQSCRSSIQATIKEYPGMTREEARIGAAGSCRIREN